jgi:type I restriction enzyme S subunit
MYRRTRLAIRALGELFDGPHATPTRRSNGPYFLNIASLKSGRLDLSESDHVSADDFAKWTRRVTPQAGDLLFSYETRLGEAALMPEGIEACLGRRMALLRPDRSVIDPRFLLYFYLSPYFQRMIARNTVHGATVPRIGLASMPGWEVEIPSNLAEQQAIAAVLGALDDKIAANGRAAILAVALADNAYDKLREQATQLRPLADLVETQYGLTASASTRNGPCFVRVTDINKTAWIDWPSVPSCELSEAELRKYSLRPGDILVARMADPGKPAFIDPGSPDAVFASYLVRLTAHDSIDSLYVYYFLRSREYQKYANGSMSGSVQKNMNARVIVSTQIAMPARESLLDFNGKISPLRRLMNQTRRESDKLAKTRDELLPLLMSGRIRVRDAEKVVEEVV